MSLTNFDEVLQDLSACKELAVDTETTGLYPYLRDHIFSIAVATADKSWYFNLNPADGYEEYILTKEHMQKLQEKVFSDTNKRFFLHNAKFDMAFLAQVGIQLLGHIHDTAAIHRVLNNEEFFQLSLDNLAKKVGGSKSNAVEEFIHENNLWEWEKIPGKDKRERRKYFNQVPLDIISEYAKKDASLTYQIGTWQLQKLAEEQKQSKYLNVLGPRNVYINETRLTKTVYKMERRGVRIDVDYCKKAEEHFKEKLTKTCDEFKKITGVPFKNHERTFTPIFQGHEQLVLGPPSEKTGKQNYLYDSDILSKFKHPAAKLILEYRDAKSRLDFFETFLFHTDRFGILHPNFNQGGTRTGRFSSSNPNFQNLTKDEDASEDTFAVRRAIIPREGFFFAMLDYDQVEYRFMLDQAGCVKIIEKILGGLDVHQSTADLAKITRKQAKTTNFGILYGQGLVALSQALGVGENEAKRIREAIFREAPELESLIYSFSDSAKRNGFITNWFGRKNYFPNINFAYRAANAATQGGAADVIKIAMNRIDDYLRGRHSAGVLTIHDELVFEIEENETPIIYDIKHIMETVYPQKRLPLTVGIEHSFRNLSDKIEGMPGVAKARDSIPKPNQTDTRVSP